MSRVLINHNTVGDIAEYLFTLGDPYADYLAKHLCEVGEIPIDAVKPKDWVKAEYLNTCKKENEDEV